MNTISVAHGNTLMVAHRGVSGLEKENTLSAFIAAGNRSYWGIETDVHHTADGQIIVIHDSNTERLTGVGMIVEETDYESLRKLKLLDMEGNPGRMDLHMPSLTEYISTCKKYEKNCVLELKKQFADADICKVIDEIRAQDYLDHVVFIAFARENLLLLRKYLPTQPVQQLSSTMTEELFDFIRENRFDLDLDYHALTEEWVGRLHDAGIKINCWTVDHPEDAQRLISWGVDYITSNILE